jgi:hypothetical protein
VGAEPVGVDAGAAAGAGAGDDAGGAGLAGGGAAGAAGGWAGFCVFGRGNGCGVCADTATPNPSTKIQTNSFTSLL